MSLRSSVCMSTRHTNMVALMLALLLLTFFGVLEVAAFQCIHHEGTRRCNRNDRSRHVGNCRNHNDMYINDNELLISSSSLRSVGNQVINIDENAPRDIYAMDEWAVACGVQRVDGFQLTKTSFTDIDNNDVSVMATKDLPASTPVLFVQENMILSSKKAIEEFGRLEAAEKILLSLNAVGELGYYYLMIKILVEYEKGDMSPWYPWLNSLPRYFSNGASMTPFCFECLPPLVSSLAMKERTTFTSLRNVKSVPFLSDDTKNNAELVKWAFQIAYTRSFVVQNGDIDVEENRNVDINIVIVPMADMFNHGADPEISIQYDEQGNCYAYTTMDVPAGSPLRISYGDPTNPSYLFARYGFVDESSPATFCKIIIPHVTSQLVDVGYAYNRMLFFKDTGEVSPEVWDVLLYQTLSSSNAARKRDFYNAHINGDYATKQYLHEKYYSETSEKLRNHLDTFLVQLDELSSKSFGKDFREHPRLPMILKHNEFVRNTFLTVRSRFFR
jgi:hypothetical protein